jgi:hypothetical protein
MIMISGCRAAAARPGPGICHYYLSPSPWQYTRLELEHDHVPRVSGRARGQLQQA